MTYTAKEKQWARDMRNGVITPEIPVESLALVWRAVRGILLTTD